MSLVASSDVRRKLPLTVAIAGWETEYTLTYGCAADHGGHTGPPWPAVASEVICATSAGSSEPVAAGATSIWAAVGKVSHSSCSSRGKGLARSTCRQLSIAPVGQGEMQSLQPLQTAGSTR